VRHLERSYSFGKGVKMVSKMYRPAEAWGILGIGQTKFWALVKAGKLETRKIGRATVVPAESLQQFIDSLPKTRAA